MKLYKTRSILLIELEHEIKDIANIISISVSEPCDSSNDKLLAIILLRLLIEPSHIFHDGQLVEKEAHREDITFVNVVLGESRVPIYYVSLPKDWREVLWCTSDSRCGSISSIFLDLEEIF
jgi:hypothetical protein